MVNIDGLMGLIIKVISNKDTEMDMEYGKLKMGNNSTKDIIYLIGNMDMEYMIGEMDQFTKGNTSKIIEQVMDSLLEMGR